MKLVPRSMFGRNVLLLLTLFTFNLFFGMAVLRDWVQKPHIVQLADLVARQIRSVAAGLQALPPEQRRNFLHGLSAAGDIRVEPAGATAAPARELPPNVLTGMLIDALGDRLPGGASDLRWTWRGQETLWVRMSVAGEDYWLIVPHVRLYTYPSTTIELTILTGLLSLAAAALIQRRINKPLVRLARAADRIARGESVPPISERAPEEIATLTRAFDRMSAGLAQLDKERSVMLAGVSHDLRTPLAKMRLAIEMLAREGDPALIASLLRSATEMDAIIDQFLEIARLSRAENRCDVDVNRLIHDCAESYRVCGYTLELDLRELPLIAGHPRSLRRALDNLLENAFRYAGPPVLIQSRCQGDVVRLCVLDRGPGIPPSETENLKQPFARGEQSSAAAGVGLGLAIVEQIARLHGGMLALLPRAGGGLDAQIELPLISDAEPVAASGRVSVVERRPADVDRALGEEIDR